MPRQKFYDPEKFYEDYCIFMEAIEVSLRYGSKEHTLRHMAKLLSSMGHTVVELVEARRLERIEQMPMMPNPRANPPDMTPDPNQIALL